MFTQFIYKLLTKCIGKFLREKFLIMKKNIDAAAADIAIKIQIGYFFRETGSCSSGIDKEKMSVVTGLFKASFVLSGITQGASVISVPSISKNKSLEVIEKTSFLVIGLKFCILWGILGQNGNIVKC